MGILFQRHDFLLLSVLFCAGCMCAEMPGKQTEAGQHGGNHVDGSPKGGGDVTISDSSAKMNTGDTHESVPDVYPYTPDAKSPWVEASNCTGKKSFPKVYRNFYKPDRPSQGPIPTRSVIEGRFGENSSPRTVVGIMPDDNLEPLQTSWTNLHANPGQDVRIHLAVHETPFEKDQYIHVSVLRDYEPVDADYRLLGPEAKSVRKKVVTTGLRFPMDESTEVFDVTIPADAFDEHRMYDLALMLVLEEANSLGVEIVAGQRFPLFYGGYRREPRPCAHPPLNDGQNEFEKTLVNEPYYFSVEAFMAFPGGLSDPNKVPIYSDMARLEQRQPAILNATAGHWVRAGYRPIVLVPFVDGRPVDRREYVTVNSEGSSQFPEDFLVDARVQFPISIPRDGSPHHTMVVGWPDPFRFATDFDGERKIIQINGTEREVRVDTLGSNIVRFRRVK